MEVCSLVRNLYITNSKEMDDLEKSLESNFKKIKAAAQEYLKSEDKTLLYNNMYDLNQQIKAERIRISEISRWLYPNLENKINEAQKKIIYRALILNQRSHEIFQKCTKLFISIQTPITDNQINNERDQATRQAMVTQKNSREMWIEVLKGE